MNNQAEQAVSKSVKQKSFEDGKQFRINTETSGQPKFHYDKTLGIVCNETKSKCYDVLEINQYSVKVRASILGQVEAVWCRFETFIFDAA